MVAEEAALLAPGEREAEEEEVVAAADLARLPLWSKTEEKHSKNSHLIIHFPASSGVRE